MGMLADFVNSLADDPDKERLFEAEPVAVMSQDGIEESDQRLILEGTAQEIRARLQEGLGDDQMAIYIIIMAPHG